MPPSAQPAAPTAPVALICGDEDFAVKQRARQLYDKWCGEVGGMDHETIDAAVGNAGEAQKALGKLREGLQTLPFFGGGKVVWFKDCSFLGDDRTSGSSAVTEALAALAVELKAFRWDGVRLLVSAGKVDKRKTFYKTLEKLGTVEHFAALSLDDRNWADTAEELAYKKLKALKKEISSEALAKLVANVGPNAAQLNSEVEKLAAYVGTNPDIELADVDAIVTRNKQARAFALADALGDRDLPKLLRTLDEELWEIRLKVERKSEIGLLYGLISKVRVMIFLQEMVKSGWLKADGDYNRFKSQLERVPADALPQDKRINPLAMNPYVLFRALPQSKRYTSAELIRAMDLLLQCNMKLVSSGLDESLVLQQTLTQIVRKDEAAR
ncbi:MAG: DNA polymerase III subunit delta [Proteobacteria bacterium]|nr:DNA polymerase III subunit delta [Pseudomonadota bacterium]